MTALDDVRARAGARSRAELAAVARARRISWSRSVSGTTRLTSYSLSTLELRDVAGVVYARHERVMVGVVERRRERVDSVATVVAPARPNAVTMSTRLPEHVKRTAVMARSE